MLVYRMDCWRFTDRCQAATQSFKIANYLNVELFLNFEFTGSCQAPIKNCLHKKDFH